MLLARLLVLVGMERWEDGAVLGTSLAKLWPAEPEFYFRAAYCLHELKRTKDAREVLINGPAELRESALYFYNLACYETQLGRIEEAKLLLKTCFEKNKTWRAKALDDPDLKPLWESL